jgi:hypothetical protein
MDITRSGFKQIEFQEHLESFTWNTSRRTINEKGIEKHTRSIKQSKLRVRILFKRALSIK